MKKTLYILDHENGWYRCDLATAPLDLNATILKSLSNSAVRRVEKFAPSSVVGLDGGFLCVSSGGADGMVSISTQLKALSMRAPFEMNDGFLIPKFEKPGPIFELSWTPPTNMALIMAVNYSKGNMYDHIPYLIAFDSTGSAHHLPVSNLFEDCRICLGSFTVPQSEKTTYLDIFRACLNQLQTSQWNSDLWSQSTANDKEGCRRLFRFKPLTAGFEQSPVPSDWSKWCPRVSLGFVADHILPTIDLTKLVLPTIDLTKLV